MIQRLFRAIPWLYSLWALPLLLTVVWLTPAWQSPDEPAHFRRAEQVAEGGVLGVRRGNLAGGKIAGGTDESLWAMKGISARYDIKLTSEIFAATEAVKWGTHRFQSFPNTAQYPPFFYMPDALGVFIGQHTKMSVNATLRLTRVLNGVAAATVTALALFFARRARVALLCIAMLPMTLSLFASASQDALLLAAGFLAVGLLDGVIEAERDTTPWEMWLGAGVLILIGIARPPYIALALLGLIMTRRIGKPALCVSGIVGLIVLLWCALVAWRVTVPMQGVDSAAQLRFVLGHPVAALGILIATFQLHLSHLWPEFIGKLGWLDTPMEGWYYKLADWALGLSLLAALGGRSRRFWIPLICVAGATVGLALAEWLTWTQPGALVVAGLQGRYFTVILAVLALGMPGLPALRRFVMPPALVGAALMALVTPYELVHVLVLRFYLH